MASGGFKTVVWPLPQGGKQAQDTFWKAFNKRKNAHFATQFMENLAEAIGLLDERIAGDHTAPLAE